MNALLLDTHVWLWVAEGIAEKIPAEAMQHVDRAAREGGLYVSVISVWEIGMLAAKGRIRLSKPVRHWVNEALEAPGLRLLPLEPGIALDCNDLPGDFHPDPADRILVASARHLDAPLITHDRRVIAYGQAGHFTVYAI
ncbi:MAG: type II toxin-antitoxin system VapC family toxin [Gammaproteobacteria bacterium]